MQRHTVVTHQQQVSTIFDPDVLEKYARLVPDAPERVLKVFEQNSATEREIALGGLNAAKADNRRRDWMAFSIIMGGMVTSAVFAYLGKPWLSGTTLAAIIAYAVFGYLQNKAGAKAAAPAQPRA